jgi:hypothetical protein
MNASGRFIDDNRIATILKVLHQKSEIVHEPSFREESCPLNQDMGEPSFEQRLTPLVSANKVQYISDVQSPVC